MRGKGSHFSIIPSILFSIPSLVRSIGPSPFDPMLPQNYTSRYNNGGQRNRCELTGKELEDIEGVLQELIDELTVRTDKKKRGEGTRKSECRVTKEPLTHVHRSTSRTTFQNVQPGQTLEMSRQRRFQIGEAEKTREVAFPKWNDDMAPKYQPYDCSKAAEDWETMVVQKRQIETNKQNQMKRSIPHRPFFFGTEEVATAANSAIKQVNKTIKLVKNLQFAAGTLLPNANEQIKALEAISRELRDFHTLHHDMRIEAHAPGAARPSSLFEKTPHPKNGLSDSRECVCRGRCKKSQSSSSVVTVESSIEVSTTVSSLI